MAVNVWGIVGVAVFYIVILVVGIIAGRKAKKPQDGGDADEVMIAGRNIGMFVGVFTMTATWVGGGYLNGTAEMIYAAKKGDGSGLLLVQAPIFFSLSLCLGGLLFAKRMREAGYVTMLDPLQQRLGPELGALMAVPAILGDLFWSASILSALGSTLAVILDIQLWISIIISAVIAWMYTVLGGLYSVAYTDVIQLACIVVGLVIAIPFAWRHPAVKPLDQTFNIAPHVGWIGYVEGISWGSYIDGALHLTLGGIPWQVYFQRVLSSKTARGAQTLSFLGAIGCLVMCVPPILIGAIAYSTDWNATDYRSKAINGTIDQRLALPLVLQYLTPQWVAVVGLGAVSAAVMSSADSSILSSSSMFSRNVYLKAIRPRASDREVLWVLRVASFIFCIAASAMAITINSIYGLFVLCADLVYVLLFPQLLLAVYTDWFNAYGSLTGFIVSLVFRVLGGEHWIHLPAMIPFPWYDPVTMIQYFPFRTFSMLMGMVFMVMVSFGSRYLFLSGKVDMRHDRLYAFTKRPEENEGLEKVNGEKRNEATGEESSSVTLTKMEMVEVN